MNRVPEDFHTITPQLVVKGVAEAIDWYTKALGANELLRNLAQDGKSIMHSELLLGDSRFFVVDGFGDTFDDELRGDGVEVFGNASHHRPPLRTLAQKLTTAHRGPRVGQSRRLRWQRQAIVAAPVVVGLVESEMASSSINHQSMR